MQRQIVITTVTAQDGREIIVIRVAADAVSGRWHAQRIINAFRAKTSLSRMSLDVVVIGVAGDPVPRLFGSCPEAEQIVAAAYARLNDWKWDTMTLDW